MPYLEIKSCTECPFAKYPHQCTSDDSYLIKCDHPEQDDDEAREKRIGRSYGIFFNCPLPLEIVTEEEN